MAFCGRVALGLSMFLWAADASARAGKRRVTNVTNPPQNSILPYMTLTLFYDGHQCGTAVEKQGYRLFRAAANSS
jgi:hypothetical protein